MENRQRKFKTPPKDEPTIRHENCTQAVWGPAATETCGMDHAITHKSLPLERVSPSIQYRRNF